MATRGREERRREEIGWQREGEENLIPIDKDIFNPLSLHCRTHTRDSDERGDERRGDRMVTRRRGDDPYDEDGGSTLMHCVIQCVST